MKYGPSSVDATPTNKWEDPREVGKGEDIVDHPRLRFLECQDRSTCIKRMMLGDRSCLSRNASGFLDVTVPPQDSKCTFRLCLYV